MALTINGVVETDAAELAAGTMTMSSTGATIRNGRLSVGDSETVPLTDGAFTIDWRPDCLVKVEFTITNGNGTNPPPMIVQLPDSEGTINLFDLVPLEDIPEDAALVEYVTRDIGDGRYVRDTRVGAPARMGVVVRPDLPTGAQEQAIYGIAPLGFDGRLLARNVVDPDRGWDGFAIGYDPLLDALAPVRVDPYFRGYATAQPTEAGQPGWFYRNAAVSADSAFVREWICLGGTDYLAVVVNGLGTVGPTDPGTPDPGNSSPGVYTETFSSDGSGWGPDLPWTFLTGSGSRAGGYGLMAGGFTTATIARMDTDLSSPNHSAKLTWVSTPDTDDRSVGVCTRVSATKTDLYVFEVNKSLQRFTFQKIVGGQTAYTSGFQAIPSALNLPLAIELRSKAGGVHECYINDVLVGTYNITDPALDSNTRIGAWQYNGGSVVPVDNITARVLT